MIAGETRRRPIDVASGLAPKPALALTRDVAVPLALTRNVVVPLALSRTLAPKLVLACALALILAAFALQPAARAQDPSASFGLALPEADLPDRFALTGTLLSFPPTFIAQAAIPVAGPVSAGLAAGFSWIPALGEGALASGSLAWQVVEPREERWAVSLQTIHWIGMAVLEGEGSGGWANALAAVATSPPRPTRVNLGAAVHTLPGSEYPGGDYDFSNPQLTPFAGVQRRIGRAALTAEGVWLAVDADDGWDSKLITLVSVRVPIGRVSLEAGTGLFVERFGSSSPGLVPVPPILAFSVPFGE